MDESPEGRYANYFEIGHNAFEFILDFGQSYVEGEGDEADSMIHSRLILNPFYAGKLLEMLQQAVNQHQQEFGGILTGAPRREAKPARPRGPGRGQVLQIINQKT